MKAQKRESKYKHSKQRDRILSILRNTNTHPTADWIYNQLKPEFPNLSMGTVYRNLNILVKQNKIQKIAFGSTFDRFDGNEHHHYHFICENCSRIIDIELPYVGDLDNQLESQSRLKVHRHQIDFYGLCEECARKVN